MAAWSNGFGYSWHEEVEYVTLPDYLEDYILLLGGGGGTGGGGWPVYAFTDDDFVDIVYELDDREIYNDIRSEIEITEDTEVTEPGSDPVYAYGQTRRGIGSFGLGEEKDVWTENLTGLSGLTFMDGWGEGGVGFTLRLTATLVSVDTVGAYTHAVYHVVNDSGSLVVATLVANYMYIVAPAHDGTTHTDTNQRTLTIRSTDATSIAKYGRRSMALTWPLGQTEAQMQALVSSYLSKYKEPVSRVTMTLVGKTDDIVLEILTRKISDCVAVTCNSIELDKQYFINAIDIEQQTNGILTAKWILEEVRAGEALPLLIINTGEIDTAYIAP
jgi:hypothetical protein